MLFLKIVFFATLIPIVITNAAIAGIIFKECGWLVPWRWLCLICAISALSIVIMESK